MDTKRLFSGTMPFMLAKLALGGIMVLVLTLLFALLMWIGSLFGEGGMFVALLLWAGSIGAVRFAFMHYAGYLVKAGHIAVIAEACKRGKLPKDQVKYGAKRVKERFLTANIYFAVDKLISGAVQQIHKKIDRAGNKLNFIPGMEYIEGIAKFFVSISLGYIDECCLGWTFYNRQQGAFRSAADGVVIYAQNWKVLLKSAAMTMLKTLLLLALIALAAFVPVGLIFKALGWSPLAAFILACLIAWTVKFAFIDSYIMIQMMGSYMKVAPQTKLAFDLYATLSNISSSFKELYEKGRKERGGSRPQSAPVPQAQTPLPEAEAPIKPPAQAPATKPVFCGECGARNEPGTRFCGECGAKLGE